MEKKAGAALRTASFGRGMLLSVLFNAGAKALLFLLTLLIARLFGTSVQTDVYFFIYGAMLLLSGLINAIDTQVLVPVSMRIRAAEGEQPAMQFLNFFLYAYAIAGALIVALVYVWCVPLFSFFSRFSDADVEQYRLFFILGSCFFFFQVLCNYISNILTSLHYFTTPMIVSAVNSTLIITGMLLLHHRYDVLSVIISTVIAYAIHLLLLLLLLKKLAGWKYTIAALPRGNTLWVKIGYAKAGQIFTFASNYLPLYLLSGFGNGMLSAMSYGKQVADVPNSLVTAQVANVGGVALNEEAAGRSTEAMNTHFLFTGRLLLFIMIPVSCFLFVLAAPVIRFLYEQGNFDAAAATSATVFLRLFAAGLFVIALNAWVSRVFIALQAIRQAFIYQLVMNTLFLVVTWLLVNRYGAYGYGYAMIVINAINFLLMYVVCQKVSRDISYITLLRFAVKWLFINVLIAAACYFLMPFLPAAAFLQLLIPFVLWTSFLLFMYRRGF